MKKLKAVYVEWDDSVGGGGWHRPDEVDEFVKNPGPIVYTVGYVAGKTKRRLVLAMSVHGTNLDHLLSIPWSAVRKVRKL